MKCFYCQELMRAEGLRVKGFAFHPECVGRMVLGSVAHIERRCGCFVPGSEESDPPHMTLRQAAVAACTAYQLQQMRN